MSTMVTSGDRVSQHLGDAPGLRDTAHRSVWWFGLEDLADRSQSGLTQVRNERFEQSRRCVALWIESPVGVEVRPQQPGPDQSHVVGRIAGALVAAVDGLIARIIRAKGAQPV